MASRRRPRSGGCAASRRDARSRRRCPCRGTRARRAARARSTAPGRARPPSAACRSCDRPARHDRRASERSSCTPYRQHRPTPQPGLGGLRLKDRHRRGREIGRSSDTPGASDRDAVQTTRNVTGRRSSNANHASDRHLGRRARRRRRKCRRGRAAPRTGRRMEAGSTARAWRACRCRRSSSQAVGPAGRPAREGASRHGEVRERPRCCEGRRLRDPDEEDRRHGLPLHQPEDQGLRRHEAADPGLREARQHAGSSAPSSGSSPRSRRRRR